MSPLRGLVAVIGNLGESQRPLRRGRSWAKRVMWVLRPISRLFSPWVTQFVMLAGIAALEVFLVVGVVLGSMAVMPAIAIHLAVVAGLVWGGVQQKRDEQKMHVLYAMFVLNTAWLGPIGSLGVALAALLLQRFSVNATGLAEGYAMLFPPLQSSPGAALYERIRRGESGVLVRETLAPFADVMASGSVDNRQAVIALISAHFDPVFAQALRSALNDDEPGVRVQAAMAVSRIETSYLTASISLADHCAHEPHRSECTLALARHCDDHANTGLLDVVRAHDERLQALDRYRSCERQGGSAGAISNAVIRLLVRLDRQEEAVEAFASLVESGQAASELFAWYAECLFKLGRYAALRQACQKFAAKPDDARLSEPCRLALSLWAGNSLSS